MSPSPCGCGGSRRCAAVLGANEKLAALEPGPCGMRMLGVDPGMLDEDGLRPLGGG